MEHERNHPKKRSLRLASRETHQFGARPVIRHPHGTASPSSQSFLGMPGKPRTFRLPPELSRSTGPSIRPRTHGVSRAHDSHHESVAKPYLIDRTALFATSSPRPTSSTPSARKWRAPCPASHLRLLTTILVRKIRAGSGQQSLRRSENQNAR